MPEILYPWPPRVLHPNCHKHRHWGPKATATKKLRRDCFLLTPPHLFLDAEILLTVTFHPPSNPHHDLDNAVAAAKAVFDGMADKWGVNDSRFKLAPSIGGKVKFGAVRVRF